MGGSWVEERFEDYKLQLDSKQHCLSVWELIRLVGSGHFSKGMDKQGFSMGINEVYQELILDVLKQVSTTTLLLLLNNSFFFSMMILQLSSVRSEPHVGLWPVFSATGSTSASFKVNTVFSCVYSTYKSCLYYYFTLDVYSKQPKASVW